MTCKYCGAKLSADLSYCPVCGREKEKIIQTHINSAVDKAFPKGSARGGITLCTVAVVYYNLTILVINPLYLSEKLLYYIFRLFYYIVPFDISEQQIYNLISSGKSYHSENFLNIVNLFDIRHSMIEDVLNVIYVLYMILYMIIGVISIALLISAIKKDAYGNTNYSIYYSLFRATAVIILSNVLAYVVLYIVNSVNQYGEIFYVNMSYYLEIIIDIIAAVYLNRKTKTAKIEEEKRIKEMEMFNQ